MQSMVWMDMDNRPVTATEGRVHIQESDGGSQKGLRLVFTNVEKNDAGQYTCSDVESSISFELIVYRSISFSDTPKEQHAPEGDTAMLVCNVRADPKPVVNWYFRGSKIDNGPKFKRQENHSLLIHNLTRSDAGDYKCKAFVITPLATQVKDLDITLKVQYSPEVIGDQRVVTYTELGSTKYLQCSVISEPLPLFQWLRDDMIINNGSNGFLIYGSGNHSTFLVPVKTDDDLGEYICRASNALGSKEVIFEIREGESPLPPELSVIGEDQGVVKLKIVPAEKDTKNPEFPINGYRVEYILATDAWENPMMQDFDLDEPLMLKNLSFNTEYLLRASVKNLAGYGHFSDTVKYKTHSLEVASVIASASSMIASSIVLAFSIAFLRLF
ncbi:roundabout homolog 2-like isoform X2 [Uloborus diversus]|nr:roundabout homolog 2-like isoform X2 [Uloborus diversus]